MIEIDPLSEAILNHFFNKNEKVVAFQLRPGRNKIVLVEVDKKSLVNLKDWQEFRDLCIPVPICLICQMWHTCRGKC